MSLLTTAHILPRAIATSLGVALPTLADSVTGRLTSQAVDARIQSWSLALLRAAKVDLCVDGLSNIERSKAYVVMSNHQSLYDIPALFRALPLRIRMVAKKELFDIPIWGKAMQSAGIIEVDRKNRARAIESLRVARALIRDEGISVWIAPEGTRSQSGALGPFKQGGFHLALETQTDILPVAVLGTRAVLGARRANVTLGQRVTVRVGEVIRTSDYDEGTRYALVERVRTAIGNLLSA